MDEPAIAWSAPVGAVVLGAVAAVGLGAWALLGTDPAGTVLLGVAAVALAVAAVVGARARPRLCARPDALEMRTLAGLRSWPWARVDAVRVVRMRRLGLPGTYVELDVRDDDGTERLMVLGRLELGTDPVDVAEALQHHRARAGRADGDGMPGSAHPAGRGGVADDGTQREVADDDDEDEPDDDRGDGGDRDRRP